MIDFFFKRGSAVLLYYVYIILFLQSCIKTLTRFCIHIWSDLLLIKIYMNLLVYQYVVSYSIRQLDLWNKSIFVLETQNKSDRFCIRNIDFSFQITTHGQRLNIVPIFHHFKKATIIFGVKLYDFTFTQ